MALSEAIDGYCERLGPEYWAEPVNAVTNAAFLIAAFVMWPRVQGQGMATGRALTILLGLIGIGSFLFHTTAQVWSAMADTLPILLFILLFIFAANRDFWGMRTGVALATTLMFFPYEAITVPLFREVPLVGASAAYWPVPLLILIYAVLLRRRLPEVSSGLTIGAAILVVSLTFRSLDDPLCHLLPTGTHFLWHLLNAIMLAWMIEVWRRHRAGTG